MKIINDKDCYVQREDIEYIIIHELCHTKEKNHSEKFWKLVAKNCPEYKACEKWLRENKGIINVI